MHNFEKVCSKTYIGVVSRKAGYMNKNLVCRFHIAVECCLADIDYLSCLVQK